MLGTMNSESAIPYSCLKNNLTVRIHSNPIISYDSVANTSTYVPIVCTHIPRFTGRLFRTFYRYWTSLVARICDGFTTLVKSSYSCNIKNPDFQEFSLFAKGPSI